MTYIMDLVQILAETIPLLKDIAEDEGQSGDTLGYETYANYASNLERFMLNLKTCNNVGIYSYVVEELKKLPDYDEDTFETALRVYHNYIKRTIVSYKTKLTTVENVLGHLDIVD